MKLKKILVGMVALFLMFGTVTPVFAMIPPAESTIFTTDADPSEITRVAFFILCDDDPGYYREIEGYLLPTGSTLTMDEEVFATNFYNEQDYSYYENFVYYLGEPTISYSGFGYYQITGEEGSNTITMTHFARTLYEVIAKKDGRTEWMYFSTYDLDKKCYRVLEEGEVVDSRKRVAQKADKITIYDADGNEYKIECPKEWIRPVTFEIEENGTQIEVDGFITNGRVSAWHNLNMCRIEMNSNGEWVGWSSMESKVGSSSTLHLFTPYDRNKPDTIRERVGLWIATDELTGITYRDRNPRQGEMEVVNAPELADEVEPIRLNKLNNYLNTTAKGEDIKKVLFQIGEEKKEGYVFPADSYVGLNEEIFQKGLYDEGYYKVAEDGTITAERTTIVRMFGKDGLKTTSGTSLYHVGVIDPVTGKTSDVYFAYDSINPNCYEVLEMGVYVEEAEPVEPEDTEVEDTETEDTENVLPEDDKTDDEILEEGGSPVIADVAKLPVIAVVATAFAGVFSAAGAGIMPSIEVSSGVKARRGELHVNGDVDVPVVHFDNLEKLMIPVHVSDGEGITWVIAAKAFTPGIKDLVKVTAVPVGTDGANINLKVADDFKNKVKEETTVYLEVVATGLDVNGECNLLEKMVEINIAME